MALDRAIASANTKLKKSLMIGTNVPPPPIPAQFAKNNQTPVQKNPPHSWGTKGVSYLCKQVPFEELLVTLVNLQYSYGLKQKESS